MSYVESKDIGTRFNISPEWSKNLKELRIMNGNKTLKEVSKDIGISASTLNRLETGKQKTVDAAVVEKLSQYFGEELAPIPQFYDAEGEAFRELSAEFQKIKKENRILRRYISHKWGEEELKRIRQHVLHEWNGEEEFKRYCEQAFSRKEGTE